MAESERQSVPIAVRRGVNGDAGSDSRYMTLVQVPGRSGPVDVDAIVDRLIERGVVGPAKRDVTAKPRAGRVPGPAGKWALLVSLPGQSWAYLSCHAED